MGAVRTAARVALGTCGVWLLATAAAANAGSPPGSEAAAKPKPACEAADSVSADGTLESSVAIRVRGRRYRLEVKTVATPGAARASSFALSGGHRTLLRGNAAASADGFTLSVEVDAAARGIRQLALTSPDGVIVTGTVDGRALAPFAIGATTAPLFVDGGKAPVLKMKPLLRRVLRKVTACLGAGSPAAISPRGIISSCDLCNAGCGLAFAGCGFGALLSAAAGVGIPALAVNISSCEKALFDCTGHCTKGSACCPVPCAGGHGIAIGNNVCDATCSEGAVCCGGSAHPNGTCCDSNASCCGPFCIDTTVGKCADPNTGSYCQFGRGDVCSDTQLSGPFAYCCPDAAPVCRDVAQHLCCARDAGEACTIDGEPGCCPPDHPFCSRGTAPGCCAEPVCCDPPQSKCGSTCCDPLTQVCVDPNAGVCAEAPPDVVIDQPAEGEHVFDDTPVTLAGHDVGLGRCQVNAQNGQWTSDGTNDQIPAHGCTVSATFHGTGPRVLTFTVKGAGGTPGSASIHVTVDPKPAVVASILAPSANTAINVDNCDDVFLEAYATGIPPLTLKWTWLADQLGCAPFAIAASCPALNIACTVQPPPDTYVSFWHSCGPPAPPCVGTGKLRLEVTDSLNQTKAREIDVSLVRNPD